jgi:hypothetical protein
VLPTQQGKKIRTLLGGCCSVTSKIMFSLLTLLHGDLAIMHTNCTDWGLGRSIASPDENSRTGKQALKKPSEGNLTADTDVKINSTYEPFLKRL